MAGRALGVVALTRGPLSCPCDRNLSYRAFILVFTFFIYTSYHLSRKPISVVKNVLFNASCTNITVLSGGDCGWKPFDDPNHAKELLGALDLAFLFSYAVGMFISGHIAERMNLRYFLTFGMLGSGILTMLFGFGRIWQIHYLWYYIIVQCFCGLLQSTGWPSVVTVVANWFGKGKRGLIMGLWNAHTSVGNILGSVIAGAFVDTNWGLSFIVPGIIITTLGILAFLFLIPNPSDVQCSPADHHATSRTGVIRDYVTSSQNSIVAASSEEADPLVQVSDEEDPSVQIARIDWGDNTQAISFLGALKIPGVIEFSLCLFFAKLVSYVFLFWLPTYIKHSTSYDPETAADLSTLFDVGGIIGGTIAGFVSDQNGARASTCAVMLVAAAPMLFLYERFGSLNLAINIVMLMVTGALVNGPYALITTAVSADLGTHRSLRGNAKALSTVTAIIDGTGSVGAAVGPLLTGIISDAHGGHGWTNVFWMLIAADICAFILLARLVSKETCCRTSGEDS